MTSQEKTRPQGIDDGVCIGVPVAHGYPAASPDDDDDRTISHGIACIIVIVVMIPVLIWIWQNDKSPSFKVESIYVSLEHNGVNFDDSQVTAKWNIAFSVQNKNLQTSFHYHHFNVWVMCMSKGSSVAVLPSLHQGHRNTTLLNATVNTTFSPHDLPPLIQGLEFDVMFRFKWGKSKEEYACKDMRVEFSSNATKGTMVGGPKSCHSDDDDS